MVAQMELNKYEEESLNVYSLPDNTAQQAQQNPLRDESQYSATQHASYNTSRYGQQICQPACGTCLAGACWMWKKGLCQRHELNCLEAASRHRLHGMSVPFRWLLPFDQQL
jgi:hypothetical protein